MTAWAIGYVLAYAPPFPIGDEFALWTLLPPRGSLSWETLWSLHNEHRIPLPRLVHAVPYLITGDLRSAMVLQVLVLGAAALGLALVARKVRGRTSWSDALFPLLLLHVGNWTNLLSGFQIALSLPTAFTCTILTGIVVSPAPPRAGRAIAMGLALACLPLCGAVGLSQLPVLGLWLAWTAVAGARSDDPGERAGGWILLALVLVAFAIGGLYAVGYERPAWYRYTPSVATILGLSAAVSSLALGPVAERAWPVSGIFVAGAVGSAALLLVQGIRAEPRELRRRLGILAVLVAIGCLVLSIAYGRSSFGWRHGFVARFVTLTAPFLLAAHLAWTLYGGRRPRSLACGVLALAALLALPFNARVGIRHGRDLADRVQRFLGLASTGPTAFELVQAFMNLFPPHLAQKSRLILETLAEEGRPPFDRAPAPSREAFHFLTFSRVPERVDAETPTIPRYLDGHHVLLVRAGTAIRLHRFEGDRRITGGFGVPMEVARSGRAAGIRVLVEVVPRQGAPRVLLDRTLDAASEPGDRGRQAFDLDVSAADVAAIVLRTEAVDGDAGSGVWSYWTGVAID